MSQVTVTLPSALRDRLKREGRQANLDERREKIGYKIRSAQLQKVFYVPGAETARR